MQSPALRTTGIRKIAIASRDPSFVGAARSAAAAGTDADPQISVIGDASGLDAQAMEGHDIVVIDLATPFGSGAFGPVREHFLLVDPKSAPAAPTGKPISLVTAHPRSTVASVVRRLLGAAAHGRSIHASRILGETAAMIAVREQIARVARFADVAVLVAGETGTGKELVAEAIHMQSDRAPEPFVAVNCAAFPEALVESELFGHEAGAYTGAKTQRVGLLESAGAGTIFLDEIGEMPAVLQPKLLRALEARRFRRIGSNRDIPLRARVVSATNNTNLGTKGRSLRPDLYFRLAGFTIELPPLRSRRDDIPLLARHFLFSFVDRHGSPPMYLSQEALDALLRESWLGNVRELRAAVEHAAILSTGGVIELGDVEKALRRTLERSTDESEPPAPRRPPRAPPAATVVARPPSSAADESAERELIVATFVRAGRSLNGTSRLLGIPRSTLRRRLERYGAL